MLPPFLCRAGRCLLAAALLLCFAGCKLKKDHITCPPAGSVPITLTLTAPNGGEIVAPLSPGYTITWNSTGLAFVRIDLSRDNGATWTTLTASTFAVTGSYTWTPTEGPSTQCLIRISDASVTNFDTSDATFTIPFLAAKTTTLPSLARGKAAWGDYDNDGKLDLALIGCPNPATPVGETHLYHNLGGGSFSEVAATGFINVFDGDLCWADLDGDGDVDLVICGDTGGGTPSIHVYENTGGGSFTDKGNGGLPAVLRATVRAASSDLDGSIDLAVMGFDGTSLVADAYYNNRDFTFWAVGAGITPVEGTLEWINLNNDNERGLIVTGTPDGTAASALFVKFYWDISDGWNRFDVTTDKIAGQALAVGDFNADGYTDFAVTGYDTAGNPLTRLYLNTTADAFTDAGAGLTAAGDGSLCSGDFNNDGKLDLAVMGSTDGTQPNVTTLVWWGDGAGGFTASGEVLTGVNRGSLTAADWDVSSDLDLFLCGVNSASAAYGSLIQNVGGTTNTQPPAPLSVTATPFFTDRVNITWSAPADDHTPSNALQYNIRIGTTPGGNDILAGQANATNGFRRIVGQGHGFQALTFDLWSLASGTYYYSVQAIDGSWAGGAWSTENTFVIP